MNASSYLSHVSKSLKKYTKDVVRSDKKDKLRAQTEHSFECTKSIEK